MLELVNIAYELCENFYRDYVMLRGVYLLGHFFWYILISPYSDIFLFLKKHCVPFCKDCICKCTDGEGTISANQSAFNAQHGVHHSLQMSPTSLNEGAELQGEERIQVSFADSEERLCSWYTTQ